LERQLKLTLNMPEILVIGSLCLYQYAFAFSIILLVLGISGRVMSYAVEMQEKKEQTEAGKEAIRSVIDSVSNALTLGNIVNSKKDNGFH